MLPTPTVMPALFKSRLLYRATVILTLCYCLYLLKSLAGVNLSRKYSAPKVFKVPISRLAGWS